MKDKLPDPDFYTRRLSVKRWTHHAGREYSEKELARSVIRILTPTVTKALPDGWQNISTVSAARHWIEDRVEESLFLTIKLKAEDRIVGFIFLYEDESDDIRHELRFGYLLSEAVWGQGLGTELIEGLIRWCKNQRNIKSISGGVETDNLASIKVLEKTGFKKSTLDYPTEEVIFYEYRFDI